MKQTFLIILSALTILSSCKKDEETIIDNTPGAASITFDAVVGSEDFALGKDFTVEGKTYNFKMLRYWVSNVVLVKSDGTEFSLADSYFLIEETPALDVQDGAFTYPAKKRESVSLANVPNGEYSAVRFSIGVASKYNDNLSLQAGELSLLSGMTNISWMWHTSYIFSALHGKITAGGETKDFVAETGLNTNYKTVTVNLINKLKVSSSGSSAIALKLDVSKLFNGIDLVAKPVIGASEAEAMSKLATNYTTAISEVVAK